MLFGLDTATLLSRIVILLIAFTVHEFSHAWSADRLGDNTPRMNGRLTLNPMAHLDLWGSLLLLVAGFGWARPVPVNPYALQRRTPAGLMLVSIAGPFSNFMLAILAAIPLRMGWVPLSFQSSGMLPSPSSFLIEFIFINLALMLFNLIPLAPLDGEKVAQYLFPPSWGKFLDTIRPYGPMILILIIFAGRYVGFDLFGMILYPVQMEIFSLLIGV
jgi:Zn-dependent protease